MNDVARVQMTALVSWHELVRALNKIVPTLEADEMSPWEVECLLAASMALTKLLKRQ